MIWLIKVWTSYSDLLLVDGITGKVMHLPSSGARCVATFDVGTMSMVNGSAPWHSSNGAWSSSRELKGAHTYMHASMC
jgi:hypothetical protein